jgi:hypothetical protein
MLGGISGFQILLKGFAVDGKRIRRLWHVVVSAVGVAAATSSGPRRTMRSSVVGKRYLGRYTYGLTLHLVFLISRQQLVIMLSDVGCRLGKPRPSRIRMPTPKRQV